MCSEWRTPICWITYVLSFFIVLVLAVFQRHLLLALFRFLRWPVSIGIGVVWLDYLLIAMMVMAIIAPSCRSRRREMSIGLLIPPAATIYLLSDSYEVMLWGGAFLGMGRAP